MAYWWNVKLYKDVELSNQPGEGSHWQQACFLLSTPLSVDVGDELLVVSEVLEMPNSGGHRLHFTVTQINKPAITPLVRIVPALETLSILNESTISLLRNSAASSEAATTGTLIAVTGWAALDMAREACRAGNAGNAANHVLVCRPPHYCDVFLQLLGETHQVVVVTGGRNMSLIEILDQHPQAQTSYGQCLLAIIDPGSGSIPKGRLTETYMLHRRFPTACFEPQSLRLYVQIFSSPYISSHAELDPSALLGVDMGALTAFRPKKIEYNAFEDQRKIVLSKPILALEFSLSASPDRHKVEQSIEIWTAGVVHAGICWFSEVWSDGDIDFGPSSGAEVGRQIAFIPSEFFSVNVGDIVDFSCTLDDHGGLSTVMLVLGMRVAKRAKVVTTRAPSRLPKAGLPG